MMQPLHARCIVGGQFNLGNKYRDGKGVEPTDVEAVRWYRAAAAQEYACAQVNLGLMYDNGRGVAQDYVEARRWYALAADQGNSIAQCNLGAMHYNGQRGPVDYATAAPDGKIVCSGVGKIAVVLEGGRGTKAKRSGRRRRRDCGAVDASTLCAGSTLQHLPYRVSLFLVNTLDWKQCSLSCKST
jgi:hypothetical protein